MDYYDDDHDWVLWLGLTFVWMAAIAFFSEPLPAEKIEQPIPAVQCPGETHSAP